VVVLVPPEVVFDVVVVAEAFAALDDVEDALVVWPLAAEALLPVADAPAAPAVIADVVGLGVGPGVALTLVAAGVAADVAADCATGPVNSGAALWRPTTPCVSTAISSTGTSPIAGTSHHHRHAGALTPRLERTA